MPDQDPIQPRPDELADMLQDLATAHRRGETPHIHIRYLYQTEAQLAHWRTTEAERMANHQDLWDEVPILDHHIDAYLAGRVDAAGVVTVADLGCGNGVKTGRFIDLLKGRVPLRYLCVDVNPAMLDEARQRLAPQYPDVDLAFIEHDLEQLDPNALGLETTPAIYVLLGFTLGNFDHHAVLAHLNRRLKAQDLLVVVLQHFQGVDEPARGQAFVEQYLGDASRRYNLMPMRLLGFGLEDLAFQVEFNLARHRIEAFARIDRVPSDLPAAVQALDFQPGERVRLFYSWKPTLADLTADLERHLHVDQIVTGQKGSNVVVAFCRKIQAE
jgi:uncharacterized SAM-dependent methyltransferase